MYFCHECRAGFSSEGYASEFIHTYFSKFLNLISCFKARYVRIK